MISTPGAHKQLQKLAKKQSLSTEKNIWISSKEAEGPDRVNMDLAEILMTKWADALYAKIGTTVYICFFNVSNYHQADM